VPITVRREIFGFVLNRLQGALLAEAFRLVGEGVVSPQDLDVTVKDGLGLRWSFMGPFETIELNAPGGLADYCARYAGSWKRIAAEPATPAVFEADTVARVTAAWGRTPQPDEIARKSAWRDRRLAALLAHKRAQPKD
jgi:L-gulonate 3-dehydrogenase